MSNEQLKQFSEEQLEAELKNRRMEKAGPWPKTIEVNSVLEIQGLIHGLGIFEDEYDYEEFMEKLYGSINETPKVELEIYQDGSARITKFNGHKLTQE